MFDERTELKINEVVVLELIRAVKTYGQNYHSNHEAYAVLLEEIEEAEEELNYIQNHMTMIWDAVKTDNDNEVKSNARIIALDAVELAKEAVQIAAVCRKILGDGENVTGENVHC